jgi:hypothetical protein
MMKFINVVHSTRDIQEQKKDPFSWQEKVSKRAFDLSRVLSVQMVQRRRSWQRQKQKSRGRKKQKFSFQEATRHWCTGISEEVLFNTILAHFVLKCTYMHCFQLLRLSC